MRRPIAVALVFLVLGAALLALAAGQTWVTAHLPPADLVGGATRSRDVPLTGDQLAGGLSALAVAALAAGAALLSTRGRGRIATAALTALIGVGVLALSLHVLTAAGKLSAATSQVTTVARTGAAVTVATSATGWPVLAILAGAMVVAAGVVATRGARESRGLPNRYEPPIQRREPPTPEGESPSQPPSQSAPGLAEREASAWSALDRGEDPTLRR